MRENKYQSKLVARLHREFPDAIIVKNDPQYMQGILDLTIFYLDTWAMLEVKAAANSPVRPNQEYYVDLLNRMSFAAFIYPENEQEVLRALQQSFDARRVARLSER